MVFATSMPLCRFARIVASVRHADLSGRTYQKLGPARAHDHEVRVHASDIGLPFGIEDVEVVAEAHPLFEDEIANSTSVERIAPVARLVDDRRKLRRAEAHRVKAKLDKVVARLFSRLANGFPRVAQRIAWLERLTTGIQRFDADFEDVVQGFGNLLPDVNRVFGVNQVATVLRMPFGDDEIVLRQRSTARHDGLIHPMKKVPKLFAWMIHRSGGEQVEDVGLRAIRNLGANHLRIDLALEPTRSRSLHESVHDLAGDLCP